MTWWSKTRDGVEKHDERQPLLAAAIRVNFAVNAGGQSLSECGIYKQDPNKHPEAENVLPAQMEKARRAAERARKRR